MGNYFSYMRISTKEEKQKQKYDRQENKIDKFSKIKNIQILITFKEDISGVTDFSERLEWSKLEKIVHPGDTIIFADLSRFTRDSISGYNKYMELFNNDINMIFIDNPTINTEYLKKMMYISDGLSFSQKIHIQDIAKMILATELERVEQERLVLIQRIKDGIEASDKKSGRKPGQMVKMTEDLQADIKAYLRDHNIKQVDLMRKHNISRNTLKKYVKIIRNNMY